jgi:hypothetical protein
MYSLPVRMGSSPALLSSHIFPGQVSVSPSGGSFFYFFKKKKKTGLDELSEVRCVSPGREGEREKRERKGGEEPSLNGGGIPNCPLPHGG